MDDARFEEALDYLMGAFDERGMHPCEAIGPLKRQLDRQNMETIEREQNNCERARYVMRNGL